jgi:voltage-gated potassium channel Kch
LEPIFIAFNTTLTNSRATAVADFVSGAAFAFDLLVNFRTGIYYVCEGHVKLVLDARTIASEYVRRYFLVDLLAAVPFLGQLAYYGFILVTGAPPATHSLLVTVMRAFRLLRVVRLWKLFLSRRAMLGMEIFVVHQTGTPLIVFGATVVYWFAFLVNLMACVFIFTATAETFCDSWVTQLAVESSDDVAVASSAAAAFMHIDVASCGGVLAEGMTLPPGRDIYVTAIYFATMTLTTVGYGDVVAKTQPEKLVVVVFMLVGAFFIATITGQMVSVLAKHGDAHAAEQAFKDKMVEADRFVKDNGLPPAVQRQVLGWVQHAYMPHEARFSWRGDLLAELPVAVRASAVAAMVGDAALRDALRGASSDTLSWVAGRMAPRALHTGHYLTLAGDDVGEMYVTASGSLIMTAPGGRAAGVLPGRGHVVGGAAAARALEAADGDGAAANVWPLSVQAAVESSLFVLSHASLRSALRMGALAAGRPLAEEAAAVGASLTRVDAVERAARAAG